MTAPGDPDVSDRPRPPATEPYKPDSTCPVCAAWCGVGVAVNPHRVATYRDVHAAIVLGWFMREYAARNPWFCATHSRQLAQLRAMFGMP